MLTWNPVDKHHLPSEGVLVLVRLRAREERVPEACLEVRPSLPRDVFAADILFLATLRVVVDGFGEHHPAGFDLWTGVTPAQRAAAERSAAIAREGFREAEENRAWRAQEARAYAKYRGPLLTPAEPVMFEDVEAWAMYCPVLRGAS